MIPNVIVHEEKAAELQKAKLVPVEVVPEHRTLDLPRSALPDAIKKVGAPTVLSSLAAPALGNPLYEGGG